VLVDRPDMNIRGEGHTDNEGSDSFNLKLSDERASSVRSYLSKKGVQANRLQSVGHGETQPIDTNRTAAGRANNRRVEFHIVE
jgi:outer membrane protein OmpA-like peptidoglycan-associated protein